MSNTTAVTPYDPQPATSAPLLEDVAALAAAGIAGTVTVINWLAEQTQEQKAAIAAAREQDRKRLVAAALRVTSVGLNLRDSGSLVASAKALGYLPAGLSRGGVMLLQNVTGQRLAVETAPSGKVLLHSPSGRASIETVVRQHTFDQVRRHLEERGMGLRTAPIGTMEVQVTGSEQRGRHGDGQAVVNAHIHRDGTLLIDVNQIKGSRCERIVAGLVQAVGGEVTEMRRKHSYFELPGETTGTKVKVRG
jgi:hypothetical protein